VGRWRSAGPNRPPKNRHGKENGQFRVRITLSRCSERRGEGGGEAMERRDTRGGHGTAIFFSNTRFQGRGSYFGAIVRAP